MHIPAIIALVLGFTQSVRSQNLTAALANYPEASTFRGLIGQIPNGISSLLPTSIQPNSTEGVTILVPTDKAFQKYLNATNVTAISQLPIEQLLPTLKYHIMCAKLTSTNFSADAGLIVPTALQDEQYNNRTAGADLIAKYGAEAAQGAPVYVSRDPTSSARFRVRQNDNNGVPLRGGMGQGGLIDAVNGAWDLGYFQLVDTILILPATCWNTVKGQADLSSFGTALTNTNLTDTIDHAANVTCLAPTNTGFEAAGNPQNTVGKENLTGTLLSHTLPEPVYSPFLTDGMVIISLAGTNVTVRIIGDDIYFNDAKVINPNVLTNNGLIHVLDRVMSPNGTAPAATSSTGTGTAAAAPTGTGTGTAGATTKPTNAAGVVRVTVGGLSAFVGAAAAAAVWI